MIVVRHTFCAKNNLDHHLRSVWLLKMLPCACQEIREKGIRYSNIISQKFVLKKNDQIARKKSKESPLLLESGLSMNSLDCTFLKIRRLSGFPN